LLPFTGAVHANRHLRVADTSAVGVLETGG